MTGPSWGYTYNKLDELFKPILEKFGKPAYGNFYPFKSSSGKWYVFWNKSYGDIQIWDVETKELVVTKVYSNKDENAYFHHANFSTYVPCHTTYVAGEYNMYANDYEFDSWIEDGSLESLSLDDLVFTPIAFNAWTIWAADNEFYCDLIDLSKIDEGKIGIYKDAKYTLSREIKDVRSVVHVETETWNVVKKANETNKEFAIRKAKSRYPTSSFKVLEDTFVGHFDFEDNSLGKYKQDFEIETKMPWQIILEKVTKKT